VNSHVDKLFRKRKRIGQFIFVGVVMQRDDGCGTTVKGNDDCGWSFDGMVLRLGRRQNRDAVEWWRE
jgi:hypothetical protein